MQASGIPKTTFNLVREYRPSARRAPPDKRFEAVLDAEDRIDPARQVRHVARGPARASRLGCARPRERFDPNQIIKRTIEIEVKK